MIRPWLRALAELERDNEPAVLVTVVAARGSTPREAGCKMVVTRMRQFDTIGGGNLEFTCAAAARAMLHGAAAPVLRDFPLGPELGQCCGGHVSVLFEPLRPSLFQVALFGAGHVGRALVGLLAPLPLRVNWFDTRTETLADAPSDVRTHVTDDPAADVALLPAGSLVLVMTHDHQIDFSIVAAALPRPDLTGVGLIGSASKRARFSSRLSRAGLTSAAIERLICPIGISGVEGKLPAEIAISVAAQILRIRQRTMLKHAGASEPAMVASERGEPSPVAADCGDCVGACTGKSPLHASPST